MPEVNLRSVTTSFAGVRAVAGERFHHRLEPTGSPLAQPGRHLLAGADSAPAIAEHIPNLLRQAGEPLRPRPTSTPRRAHIARFRTDHRRAAQGHRQQPRLRADHLPLRDRHRGGDRAGHAPARCRPDPGRHQAAHPGGHGPLPGRLLQPRVMELLCRETGQTMEQLTKFGGGSYIVCGKVKEGK